jgi:hypothetical protein
VDGKDSRVRVLVTTSRIGGAVIFGCVSAALVFYAVWVFTVATQPASETPRVLTVTFGIAALLLATLFAFPAAVLTRSPRTGAWWRAAWGSTGVVTLALIWFAVIAAGDGNMLALPAVAALAGVVMFGISAADLEDRPTHA